MTTQDLVGRLQAEPPPPPGPPDRTLEDEALFAGGDDWGLFETGGYNHPQLELQRVDFPEDHPARFDSDVDAWCHVLKRAGEGRRPESAALAWLCIVSHEEIVGITYSLFFGEYRTYLPRNEDR